MRRKKILIAVVCIAVLLGMGAIAVKYRNTVQVAKEQELPKKDSLKGTAKELDTADAESEEAYTV